MPADLAADLKATIKASLLIHPGDATFIRRAKRWYADPSAELNPPTLDAYYDPIREMTKLLNVELNRVE